jgi:anti-anti-sigma regulatory factor
VDQVLRISKNLDNGQILKLRLDGRLDAASWPELEEILSRHRDSNDRLILMDLAGVPFMTNDVAKKLSALRGNGLRIINCSPFIEMLLKTLEA